MGADRVSNNANLGSNAGGAYGLAENHFCKQVLYSGFELFISKVPKFLTTTDHSNPFFIDIIEILGFFPQFFLTSAVTLLFGVFAILHNNKVHV